MRFRSDLLIVSIGFLSAAGSGACGGTAFSSGDSSSNGSGGAPATGSATTGGDAVATSSSSGGGATASSSGAGGATSTGTGPSTTCPDAPPQPGHGCDVDPSATCTYAEKAPCCTALFECQDAVWKLACQNPPCPVQPPKEGDACGCEELSCAYTGQCPNTPPVNATCSGGQWTITPGQACPVQCGDIQCMPGQYCLTKTSGGPTLLTCANNTCNGAPTCDCLLLGVCAGLKCEETGPGQFDCSP